jgi:hypothetical protein
MIGQFKKLFFFITTVLFCVLYAAPVYTADVDVSECSSQIRVTVPLYTYQTAPPYEIDAEERKGLNYELADALNEIFPCEYVFGLQHLSRMELNKRLEDGGPAMVMFSNVRWFWQIPQLLFESDPLHWDKLVVISLKGRGYPANYEQMPRGTTLGVRAGFSVNSHIQGLIDQGHFIVKFAASSEANVESLFRGEVDVVLVSRSAILYLIRENNWLKDIDVVAQSPIEVARNILVTEHFAEHVPKLNLAIKKLLSVDKFESRLGNYGLRYYSSQDLPF